jgi:hypothetical protein
VTFIGADDAKRLVCPEDDLRPATDWKTLANSNISYVINVSRKLEDDYPFVLFADRNITSQSETKVVLEPGKGLAWNAKAGLHFKVGNIAIGGGSHIVREYDSQALNKAFASPANPGGLKTNTVAVP